MLLVAGGGLPTSGETLRLCFLFFDVFALLEGRSAAQACPGGA
jgi:hypothetical protein